MQLIQTSGVSGSVAASRSAILKTIYYRGPIKRSDIAKQLALTMPTITTNINHMIASGLVKEENKLDSSANSHALSQSPSGEYHCGGQTLCRH